MTSGVTHSLMHLMALAVSWVKSLSRMGGIGGGLHGLYTHRHRLSRACFLNYLCVVVEVIALTSG
jgi:hypothetical protein